MGLSLPSQKMMSQRLISKEGSVVQLVRMPPCHGGGRGFESRPVRRRIPEFFDFDEIDHVIKLTAPLFYHEGSFYF